MRKINYWLVFMVFGTLGCNLFSQTSAQPTTLPPTPPATNLATYTNTKHSYSFQYPAELSITGDSNADFINLDNQITVNVTTFDPQQPRGDAPVIESTEQFQLGNYPATRLKGYIGAVGGGTPQTYESVVIARNGYFYIFTVHELKFGVMLPVDRQREPVPAGAMALFNQVLSSLQFSN